jgi:uncharacterized protein
MHNRIAGFDLARAYAIFGMFIVNFNVTYGDHKDPSMTGQFLALFAGNSSTVFIILAGMGVAFLARRSESLLSEQAVLRNVILKRAIFLFVAGLLLGLWWPGDILHMYGCYMAIAALTLFLNRKFYIWLALLAVAGFHVLMIIIPYETGWNFKVLQYADFYTINGFLRHTLYNGWNPVFPWMGYFFLGMYLGRLNWKETRIQKRAFISGLVLYSTIIAIEWLSYPLNFPEGLMFFIHSDYLPPMLPFFLSTTGFSLMLISGFMLIGSRYGDTRLAGYFACTGRMTFTNYVSHVTIGLLLLSLLTGKEFNDQLRSLEATAPIYILAYSIAYFLFSVIFSSVWLRYFNHGPLEMLMRKFSDSAVKKSVVSTA